MYSGAQQKQDWIYRTGNHATRPVLSAKIDPVSGTLVEFGRLAELRHQQQQLRELLAKVAGTKKYAAVGARLGAVNAEVRRLNRECNTLNENQYMWAALKETFGDEDIRRFSENLKRIRIIREMQAPHDASAIETRSAETAGLGPKDESAVPAAERADAQTQEPTS